MPPGSSRCCSASGICSIAAVTMMRSNWPPGMAEASRPSPSITSTLAQPRRSSRARALSASVRQRSSVGLVPRAGADLQHPVLLLQLQLLGHVGHHEGLADGLPAGDAERAVAIGLIEIGRLDESLARGFLHGAAHG